MDDGEIYRRIPPIFLRNAHAISLCKENPMKASTLRFELELGIECQGPVHNILLLWFIQGIFKSCWEVQQLLLLPPAPGLSLMLELYYAKRHLTLQRNSSSRQY